MQWGCILYEMVPCDVQPCSTKHTGKSYWVKFKLTLKLSDLEHTSKCCRLEMKFCFFQLANKLNLEQILVFSFCEGPRVSSVEQGVNIYKQMKPLTSTQSSKVTFLPACCLLLPELPQGVARPPQGGWPWGEGTCWDNLTEEEWSFQQMMLVQLERTCKNQCH